MFYCMEEKTFLLVRVVVLFVLFSTRLSLSSVSPLLLNQARATSSLLAT